MRMTALLIAYLLGVLWAPRCSALVEPNAIESVKAVLETTLTLEMGSYSFRGNGETITVTAPLFNGTMPGPTLLVRPGDFIQLTFENRLPESNVPYRHNEFSAPTETNLHFHGLFVSGELPSDDATLVLQPGMSFTYRTQIPMSHSPGTHWYHPHRHGSTALQLAGGAAGALIVQDDDTVPPQYSQAPSHICILQEYNPRVASEVIAIAQASDIVSTTSTRDNRIILLNGEVTPSIPIATNVWTRLRWINAGWEGDSYDLRVEGCELALLAKDGIFVRNAPRQVSSIHLFIGGRADVMVRCPNAGSVNVRNLVDNRQGQSLTDIATLQVSGGETEGTAELEPWNIVYPEYLQDLRATSASDGCSCTTRLDDDAVNGLKFEYDRVMHQSYLGAVVERNIRSDRHPYHQHVYPFQLVAEIQTDGGAAGYYQVGDWHDTFEGNAIVRYQPQQFESKVMLHCHKLTHEDVGMMAIEQVVSGDAGCGCNLGTFLAPSSPTSPPAALVTTPLPSWKPTLSTSSPTATMTTPVPSGKPTPWEQTATPSSTRPTLGPSKFPKVDTDPTLTPTVKPSALGVTSPQPAAALTAPSNVSYSSSNDPNLTVSSSPTALLSGSSALPMAVVGQAVIVIIIGVFLQ